MIGGDSRLVFEIPANINSLPLDINELLAWENFNLVVNDRAKQPSRQKKTKPQSTYQSKRCKKKAK
jgi:hypothetical protein